MNKKGIATSTIIRAVLTVVVIVIIVWTIYAFVGSLKEQATPLVQDFNQAIQVDGQAVQAPKTQEDQQLVSSFDNLIKNFEECQFYSNSDCGCNINPLQSPLTEDYYFAVANTQNGLFLAAFTNEQVPLAQKSYSNIKLGLLDYDEDKDKLQCIFPNFIITKSSANSNLAITSNEKEYYDIIISVQEKDIAHLGLDSIESYESKTLPPIIGFRIINIYGDYYILWNNKWQISKDPIEDSSSKRIGTKSYNNVNGFLNPQVPKLIEDIFYYIKPLSQEQGIDYVNELAVERLTPKWNHLEEGELTLPNIIKVNTNTYCLVTEFFIEKQAEISSTKIEFPLLGQEKTKFYFEEYYPYFYLDQMLYCSQQSDSNP